MSARQQVHLTQEQAELALDIWRCRLRLEDWDIKVKVCRACDMPADTQGRCQWVLARKEALIKLLHPVDWDPTLTWPQDMEATLVHELLHLHMAPFDEFKADSAENTALEQAIHHISFALVNTDRQVA